MKYEAQRKSKPFETMEVFSPMKQMVPLKKQSKKAQKEQHAKQRGSWHGISPVTRLAWYFSCHKNCAKW